jgi:phenylalanyl-tRNA synthetase beta chain
MKLPISWLNDYTDISGIDPHEYADALTMSGSKVEGITELGEEIQNVVVGKILKKEKHQNADTLWVCQVDAGEGAIQIVTGAQNIEEGNLVPIARHGAKLPGGVTIKSGKLRGEKSDGMMCSHQELGLLLEDVEGACEDGILILQKACEPGTDIKKVLGLCDSVVEFEITSNRPDCLSVLGIARETAVTFDKPFNIPKIKNTGNSERVEDYIKVRVLSPNLCPRYVARAVKNVKIEPSPKWLRDRLTACGVRPINNIVDITNYIMLEYGQPMHAFDREFLNGGEIIVRNAGENEVIKTLDATERRLTQDMLVIADSERAVAVAGVMGGENSEINSDTKEIILESAMFNGTSVRITSKKLGLRTESSGRFEKGLDKEQCLDAVNRACALIDELGAGEVIGGYVDVDTAPLPQNVIVFSPDKINNFLGTDISREFMIKTFKNLGFDIVNDATAVIPPSYRSDVESFADIAEEIARMYGYNSIESTMLQTDSSVGARTFEQVTEMKIANTLTMMGCFEVLTYSFTHPKSLGMINREEEQNSCIKILNPLGEENSIMRNNMLHSIMSILSSNHSQRAQQVKVFEIGKIYRAEKLPLETSADEIKMLSVAGYGNMDFYDLKGIIENLFEALNINKFEFTPRADNPSFHPGKSADIIIGGKAAGVIGEVHPNVSENYDFGSKPVYYAEIELLGLLKGINRDIKYTQLNRYPATSRDLAMLVDDSVLAADVEKVIKRYGGKTLEDLKLFDVYKGEQIPEGKKSMAYSATFRAADRTLDEKDITRIMDTLHKMLEQEIGAILR